MKKILLLAAALCALASPAMAQSVVDEYLAYIGPDDLYNSNGDRLTLPWQIIRQDRANFHRFGIQDPDDEGDSFFASARNRDRMERMLRNGQISPSAARAVVRGDVYVYVQVWGEGNTGNFVSVEVVQ